jgi:hypothetical protein
MQEPLSTEIQRVWGLFRTNPSLDYQLAINHAAAIIKATTVAMEYTRKFYDIPVR